MALKFYNYDIVFAEVPDETALAINITGCPNRCPGCHSPHLQEDIGHELNEEALRVLLCSYGRAITCVCFMGGDSMPEEVACLAGWVRKHYPDVRTAWYSGMENFPSFLDISVFDYVKTGPWIEKAGPLSSPSTNQRFYRISSGNIEDITCMFRRWRCRE